ncbi:RagB/SusD family nutrient uptake outer membrane protein [Aggregatimonas sangjinii]|uniref:RagB/SusD family nutrient uptake outer membrane protein n=1 Tax=Aggregatimonas sangjinii TaxID=2583587 RepID=A0A5B7SW07_9FLAO|nr:RagB/SusD family nutrient uptake outer membrane protein [Aggregatimonas sangjinii]QCX00854.1 RagB/SusD family nutrient uptake outer membrane protein [Aggregatimonas sangjinii]
MKIYSKMITVFLVLATFACENELEFDPTDNLAGESALSTEENIASVLVGVYEELGQDDSYGGQLQILVDLLGNTDQANWEGTFVEPRQAFAKGFLVDNIWVRDVWGNAYEAINQANLVLERLDLITSSAAEKDRIEGEARFLRALAYFDLVRNFGLPFEFGESNGQPGVPLRLTGIIDYLVPINAARNSVQEVYDLILSDATRAYEILPDANDFYADKYAAQALLARVYFQQGDYAQARDAADDVLTNSGNSLDPDFFSAFNNDTDGIEDIFTFQVTSQTGFNDLVVHYASEADGGRGGDITIQDGYLALFDDPNDDRGDFNYINPANGSRLTLKYTNQFGNIPMFRIAEMHLIRLESNFREGTTTGLDPLIEINALRARSGATELAGPLTADVIFNERQRELAFEGFLIHDYKRTKRTVGDLPYNDDSLVFPIPQTEMDTNPLMTQNPGYGG